MSPVEKMASLLRKVIFCSENLHSQSKEFHTHLEKVSSEKKNNFSLGTVAPSVEKVLSFFKKHVFLDKQYLLEKE